MILGAIIDFFGLMLYTIVNFLPSSILFPQQINESLTWIFEAAFGWNWLLPIDTMVSILGVSILFYTGIFTFSAIKWILNLVRGAGA